MCWSTALDYRTGMPCMHIMWHPITKELGDSLKFTTILMVYTGLGHWKQLQMSENNGGPHRHRIGPVYLW